VTLTLMEMFDFSYNLLIALTEKEKKWKKAKKQSLLIYTKNWLSYLQNNFINEEIHKKFCSKLKFY
jgi:hypothetical protein